MKRHISPKLLIALFMLCVPGITAWGETFVVNEETYSKRLEINAQEYDTIVFRNAKFEETVIITGNENLKTLMFYNCDFAGMVTVRNNPALTTLAIGSSNFKKHLLVRNNIVEGEAEFSDNIISGYLQFEQNQFKGKCSIDLSRVDSGFSCFNNTFVSVFEIDVTNFGIRSVMYGNSFNMLKLNDASFGSLLMQDNYLEKSMGFTDCTVTAHLTIRQLTDSGNPDSKRSVSFYNTSVYGSVYLEQIDTSVLILDLWQLDFHQDIFLDYDRLISSFSFITDRIIHNPQTIETVVITNPYKELNGENLRRFNQLFSRVRSGFDKRGDRDVKIEFIKWEYRYTNSFNGPFIKTLKTILFFLSFEKLLNIYIPLVLSLLICIVFMFIYSQKDKTENDTYKYLNIGYAPHFTRYFIAFIVSTSVFCNLPASKKLREDNAKNITWIEGMIGMVMLIIIGAIVGRIASI